MLLAVGMMLTVAGCGRPFVDSRREAGQANPVGASTLDRPVICYAKGETSAAEVLAMAARVCAETDRVPRFDREDALQCRLMQPWRAFFTCVDPGGAGAGTVPPDGTGVGPGAGPGLGGDGPAAWRTPRLGVEDWDGSLYPGGTPPTPPRL